jgi:hypothetical protein
MFCVAGVSRPAVAQDVPSPLLREAAEVAARQIAASTPPPIALTRTHAPERRPAALLPLYASLITLQTLDIHSTRYALTHGAVEANPLMKGVVTNEIGLVAVKAAGTAGVILATEGIRRRNKTAAVVLMIATNSAMAWVVQHNYRAVR